MDLSGRFNPFRFYSVLVFFLFFFASVISLAQKNDVLFSIDGKPYYKSDFDKLYIKNNVKANPTTAEMKEYLNLVINYKLKVLDAEQCGLDTTASFRKELDSYREKLGAPYLTDEPTKNRLLNEAYERKKSDIRASHIFFRLNSDASPADTLIVYNKAMETLRRMRSGENYESLVLEYSEDPSAKDRAASGNQPAKKGNKGDLGYFTVFDMVYPFESAAYNLRLGKVSGPVRTDYGYHLIKVTDIIPALNDFEVAHLFLSVPANAKSSDSARIKSSIYSLYSRIQKGEKFEDLVRDYSEDKNSAAKGGVLPKRGVNKLMPEFIEAIAGLSSVGDISKPVLTPGYGWHIIKLTQRKPVGSFDEEKKGLEERLVKDSRYQEVTSSVIARVKKEDGFSEALSARDEFYSLVNNDIFEGKWDVASASWKTQTMFRIGNESVSQDRFANFLATKQTKTTPQDIRQYVNKMYNEFRDQAILQHEALELEDKFPEFKDLMQEYRDGILLFKITDMKVWSRAVKDESGLEAFYRDNKSRYTQPLQECKALVTTDYQNKLEKDWISQLKVNHRVTINESVLAAPVSMAAVTKPVPVASQNQAGKTVKQETQPSKEVKPPILTIVEGSVKFSDPTGNHAIDAGESCLISFTLENTGLGDAVGIAVKTKASGDIQGLVFPETKQLPSLKVGQKTGIEIPVSAGISTIDGIARFQIKVTEPNGFGTDAQTLEIQTRKFISPMLEVVDYTVTGGKGGSLVKKYPFDLQVLVQNTQSGKAENVQVSLVLPKEVWMVSGKAEQSLGMISPGETRSLVWSMIVTDNYEGNKIPVTLNLSEKYGRFARNRMIDLTLNQEVASGKIVIAASDSRQENPEIRIASLTAGVDKNIPQAAAPDPHRYALIIGNEDYSSHQPGLSTETNVDFASNDARVFKQYAVNVLGVPENQVRLLVDASASQMSQGLSWISRLAGLEKGNAELIFYYSGHGLPDENNREPYLIPVDVSGSDVTQGIRLFEVYSRLTANPCKRVTVFLDACFSGGARNQPLLAMKSVKVKPNPAALSGNLVVFTSSSGEEASGVNRQNQHGYFTYYLLKKLQESKGQISYKDLADYLENSVSKATTLESKPQTPQVLFSPEISASWPTWTLNH